MDYSPPGSCVHGISQARILEWISISFSKEPSHPRGPTHISCIGRWILFHWATWEAPLMSTCCSSISKTCPTLHPHGLQHTRLPCPSSSHHLPEFAQLLVHWINDAIQPSHPVSAFSFSQHQGLFQWVSCLYQVAKVLELQHQKDIGLWQMFCYASIKMTLWFGTFILLIQCGLTDSFKFWPTYEFLYSWNKSQFVMI